MENEILILPNGAEWITGEIIEKQDGEAQKYIYEQTAKPPAETETEKSPKTPGHTRIISQTWNALGFTVKRHFKYLYDIENRGFNAVNEVVFEAIKNI